MKMYPFLLLLLLPVALCGQQAPDSLLRAIRHLPDTARVNALNEAGRTLWISGQDSLAKHYLTQSIALARTSAFPEGEARARLQLVRIELDYLTDIETAHRHLDTATTLAGKAKNKLLEGQAYFRRAQLYGAGFTEHVEKSRKYREKARRLFVETGNKIWESNVYVEQAEIASNEGKYAEAVDLLLKARKLQEESGDASTLRATLPNLGVTYTYLEMYDEALQCFDDAEKTANALNDERIKAFVYSQRAAIYQKQKQYKRAKDELTAAISLYRSLGGTYYLPGSYTRLGEVYFEMDSTDEAFHYARMADRFYREQMESEELFHHPSTLLLGKVYLKRRQYPKVISLATEGIRWAENNEPRLMAELTEYHRQLALAHESLHHYPQALFHQKAYKSLSDSLFNTESLQRTRVAALRYDFEKKQQSDSLRITELENNKLKNTRNILIALSLLVTLAVAYITWSNKQLRRRNKEIIAKKKEVEKALDKGQQMERKRVASELHDNLNTKLAAIRWNIEALNTDSFDALNQKIYERISGMVNDAYEDVRLISHNMLPAELETRGLAEALHVLIRKLGDNDEMKFQLEIAGDPGRLPREMEHQLYNIALELINNAIKHSKATSVIIRLVREPDGLLLSVTDNGIGINIHRENNGRGLYNLRSRAEALQGIFRIETPPEGGTRAYVQLPPAEY